MWFFGQSRGATLTPNIALVQADDVLKRRLDQYYGILTILDQKATGLLTVNAFLIAGLIALLTATDTSSFGVTPPKLVLQLQLLALGISAFLCLPVIRIAWGFLRYVPPNAKGIDDFALEMRRLANVIDDRTRCYWFAWAAALIGFLLTPGWWDWDYVIVAFLLVGVWLLIQWLTN